MKKYIIFGLLFGVIISAGAGYILYINENSSDRALERSIGIEQKNRQEENKPLQVIVENNIKKKNTLITFPIEIEKISEQKKIQYQKIRNSYCEYGENPAKKMTECKKNMDKKFIEDNFSDKNLPYAFDEELLAFDNAKGHSITYSAEIM